MWKPEPETVEDWTIIQDERAEHRYYAEGAFLIPRSRQFSCHGNNYTALAYPYLFHLPTVLEWGVRGGISFQESVTPFVKVEGF